MTHTELFDCIAKGNIADCYLLDGEEEYIKETALKKLCEKLLPQGMEQLACTDLTNPSPDEIIAACETLPFLCDKRLVIVRDLQALSSSKKKEESASDTSDSLVDYINHIPPTTCLVFYTKGKSNGTRKLTKALKTKKTHIEFSVMSNAECARWLKVTMKRSGKKLGDREADQLIFTVGRDAATLLRETEKLAAYMEDRAEVTSEDIDAICAKSAECTVFQMVDAQVDGRMDTARDLLRRMLEAGESQFGIQAMLLRQYRILYHVRCLMDERVPAREIPALVGIPPFAAEQAQRQIKRFDRAQIKAAYEELLNYEFLLKQGLMPQEHCTETSLFRLESILRGS